MDWIYVSLMMKSVGGFFIKRKFETKSGKKDTLYRNMLHSYMRKSLINNNDMEFFIEGGRTRTGKPCLPKGKEKSDVKKCCQIFESDNCMLVKNCDFHAHLVVNKWSTTTLTITVFYVRWTFEHCNGFSDE